ncbi:MAG: VCBS repeat-containing protein [Myxococcaceae bacterium]|nr:VCBS repeat-containing protein [Myxococcaceae bacterium]
MTCAAVVTSLAVTVLSAAPPASAPALEQLAKKVAEHTALAQPEAPVGVYVEAPTPGLQQAFATAFASALTSRQLAGVTVVAPETTQAEALARTRDLRTLAEVVLSLSGTTLTAQTSLVSTWVNFWSGNAAASVSAQTFTAQVDADLAVRALAAVPATGQTALAFDPGILTRLPQPPVALAAYDVDGDKRAEVAVLMEDALWLLAPDGKVLATYDLRVLPRAVSVSREPFGVVAFISNPVRVVFLSGKYAEGQCLAFAGKELKVTSPVSQVSVDGFFVGLKPGVNSLAADVYFGKPASAPIAPLTATSSRGPVTLFVYADGTGQVVRGVGSLAHFRGIGSGSTLLDVDGDGQAEVLASSARHFPADDELKLFSARTAESVGAKRGDLWNSAPLWQGAATKGRVLTAAAGDLDGDGKEEALLGVWLDDGTGELQFLKKADR